MEIKTITPVQAQQSTATVAQPTSEKKSGMKQAGIKEDSIALTAPISAKTGRLDSLSDSGNSLALHAKETDQKLTILADSIGKMAGTLDTVIKNFPPFSTENNAREDLLMSYASIRKEILQLTVPLPPPPIYEKTRHQWQELFQQNISSNTIKLPGEIGSSTPDSDLKTTIVDLTALHDRVTSLRTDLKQSFLTK